MEEKKSQKLLDTYFKIKASPQSIEQNLSKRVQKAVRKLNNDNESEESPDGEPKAKKSKKCNDKKLKKEKDTDKLSVPTHRSKESFEINVSHDKPLKSTIQEKYARECIPQREKNKACALEKKLHAIEIFRKSKQGLGKTKKTKRVVRKIKMEAELSESDSN